MIVVSWGMKERMLDGWRMHHLSGMHRGEVAERDQRLGRRVPERPRRQREARIQNVFVSCVVTHFLKCEKVFVGECPRLEGAAEQRVYTYLRLVCHSKPMNVPITNLASFQAATASSRPMFARSCPSFTAFRHVGHSGRSEIASRTH
jgi:hypothetical protein